ncbi:DUF5590 domain-containing protein [Alkalihalobacillus sp. LMS39]|uniref:cell wall elongation regulator TseB-like domain-containing protein n=1 Tax=Alkalihalobacillus sp. LMS39 TaxID=2924032 RepID=UPI001FB454C1|nr:DUF5590 domain-containing protein [Alkalihalobacillus sp. LMS39]UOE92305.1 DUF5590 domain-containing protein [Alkalihalobacillus sp. LMS39]
MKKWIIFGIALFVVVIVSMSTYFYQTIRSPIVAEKAEISEFVIENTAVTNVDMVELYHGTESYFVIEGSNEQDENIIVWINKEDRESIIVRNAADGITKDQVRSFALSELDPKKIISIRLGYENDRTVYEITYIDEEDRYSYYYMTFSDGTFVKRYSLRKETT